MNVVRVWQKKHILVTPRLYTPPYGLLAAEDETTANGQVFTGQAFPGDMFYVWLTALYV